MRFEPKKFLEISKELDGCNPKNEAHFRSIINRAYYAAFGHLKNLNPGYSHGISVHQDLIKTLKNSNDTKDIIIGKKLEDLFERRKKADYKYHLQIKSSDCRYAVRTAEEIIKKTK